MIQSKRSFFYDLGKHFYGIDQDTAIYFAQNAIQLAEKLGLDKVKGNALNIMGVALLIRSDYEDALKTHLQALKIRETLKDSTGMLESNLNIGNVYYRNGEMGKAAEMYEKALVYGLATKNLRGQSLIYNNLGNYYSDRWVANQSQEDYNLALEYLQKSLQIKEELKDNRGLVNTLTQLSSLSKNDRGKASGYLLRALNIAEANQDIENKINVLNELSNYFLQGKDYAKVREYALKSYQLAKDANSHFYISRSADFLIEAAKGQNDFKSAYEYLVIKKDSR
ncbi:tetratricopeptide repeat protein [Algoriphagus boritolerans]|uniref:tetratricopeptide repeat protein n=1 Tax=Algoriphagus boritolerans TaxID=308111 RepID=UPI000AB46331